MNGQEVFEIRITGTRNGELLTPESLDISEWVDLLVHGRNLLFPEKSKKDSPKVTIEIEHGSIRLLLKTSVIVVIQVQALMGKVNKDRMLINLPKKQVEALQFFQDMAREEQFDIRIGNTEEIEGGLHLSSKTNFIPDESAWVEVETLIWGKLVNAGGGKPSQMFTSIQKNLGCSSLKLPKKFWLRKSKIVCININKLKSTFFKMLLRENLIPNLLI